MILPSGDDVLCLLPMAMMLILYSSDPFGARHCTLSASRLTASQRQQAEEEELEEVN